MGRESGVWSGNGIGVGCRGRAEVMGEGRARCSRRQIAVNMRRVCRRQQAATRCNTRTHAHTICPSRFPLPRTHPFPLPARPVKAPKKMAANK